MEHEMQDFDMERKIPMVEVEAIEVAPHGLGFGEGSISKELVDVEVFKKVETAIKSPEILVPISLDKNGNP
jgi:hypothetical protein